MIAFAAPRGTLPVLQYCTPAQLQVDPAYQRDLDATSLRLIDRIAHAWDWSLCQPLVIARRPDGALFVVDGQHRLEAARRRGDIAQLPCVIFSPADAREEATAFVNLNQLRRPLTAYALWKGALVAGDAQALVLDGLLRAAGLGFAGSKNASVIPPGTLNNVGSVRSWHARHGDRRTRIVLLAIALAYPGQVLRAGALLFWGVGGLVLDQAGAFSADRLAATLTRSQEDWLTAFRHRAAADATGLQAAAVATLADAYAATPGDPATRRPGDPAKIDLSAVSSSMERRADAWSAG